MTRAIDTKPLNNLSIGGGDFSDDNSARECSDGLNSEERFAKKVADDPTGAKKFCEIFEEKPNEILKSLNITLEDLLAEKINLQEFGDEELRAIHRALHGDNARFGDKVRRNLTREELNRAEEIDPELIIANYPEREDEFCRAVFAALKITDLPPVYSNLLPQISDFCEEVFSEILLRNQMAATGMSRAALLMAETRKLAPEEITGQQPHDLPEDLISGEN